MAVKRMLGSAAGRAAALEKIPGIFKGIGDTTSGILRGVQGRRDKEAEEEKQKPVDDLRKQLLESQVKGSQLGVEEKETEKAANAEYEALLAGLDEEKQGLVRGAKLDDQQKVEIFKDPKGSLMAIKEQLNPDSEIGKSVREQLQPWQVEILDKIMAEDDAPKEPARPEITVQGITPDLTAGDVTLPGTSEGVLQPGQRAPEAPVTSVFKPTETGDLEKEPPKVQRARELLKKVGSLSGKTSRISAGESEARGIISDFESKKEKKGETLDRRAHQEKLQKAGFEHAFKLRDLGFLQAKTLKEMEQAAKKADVDPNRPNDTTINKDNKDIWDKLDKKYTASISEHREGLNSIRQLKTMLDQATGASDIAAIFKFMKSLDPKSVVRESEFKLPEQAGGVFNAMLNTGKKAMSGNRLSPEARRQILASSIELENFYNGAIGKANARYTKLSNAAKIDPELVVDSATIETQGSKGDDATADDEFNALWGN